MPQVIYDAHNWLRRRFETGASMRLVIADVWATPGIVVFDGYKAKQRRKALYPDYKKHRNVAPDTMYKQIDQFEKLVKFLPVISMRVPYWEADDVIATLIKNDNGGEFYVESTDVDFLQLPNTTINRGKFAAIKIKPEEMRLYKTVVGDPSDHITGIKGFGKKGWDALTDENKNILLAFCMGFSVNLEKAGLSKSSMNWLQDPENVKLVHTFWNIVGFYDVPMEEITKNMTVGTEQPDMIEQELRNFHL